LYTRLKTQDYQIADLGNHKLDPDDDYVTYARLVAEAVLANPGSFGVLVCGSGAGVDMVANKVDGIRSALAFDITRVIQARAHEDANVLALPADILEETQAYEMVIKFITTPFSNEVRHIRRLEEMRKVEEEN